VRARTDTWRREQNVIIIPSIPVIGPAKYAMAARRRCIGLEQRRFDGRPVAGALEFVRPFVLRPLRRVSESRAIKRAPRRPLVRGDEAEVLDQPWQAVKGCQFDLYAAQRGRIRLEVKE
jgi:hypothetical protein